MCDRQKHFSFNYENKGLAAKLRILGSRVFECPCDADIAIVKKALKSSKEQPVIVYADDTDILSLLLHLYHSTPDLKDIFLAEMTRPSATQMLFNQRSYQTVSKTRGPTLPYLLFAHAFTDCDMNSTYSAIYLLGKTFIFEKLKHSKRLRNSADISKNGQNPQTIGTAAFIFSSFTLVTSVIRKKICKKTIW